MIDRRRLQQAMEAIVTEKGSLTLFALLRRAESSSDWDLVVSAPWIGEGKLEAFSYVAQQVHSRLGDEQVVQLSRIAEIPPRSDALNAILEAVSRAGGSFPLELHGSNLFGLDVTDAIVFRAESPGRVRANGARGREQSAQKRMQPAGKTSAHASDD